MYCKASMVAFLGALFLSACGPLVSDDPGSPYSQVPVGSSLSLHRTMEFPPGRTRVFFQNGEETERFDHYAPSCNLEIRKLDAEAIQYVAPAVYKVSRLQRHFEEVVRKGRPIQLAMAGTQMLAMGMDGGNMRIYDGYHLWLEGEDDNLMRLTCRGIYAEMQDARPPSVNEIRTALGELMSLEFP